MFRFSRFYDAIIGFLLSIRGVRGKGGKGTFPSPQLKTRKCPLFGNNVFVGIDDHWPLQGKLYAVCCEKRTILSIFREISRTPLLPINVFATYRKGISENYWLLGCFSALLLLLHLFVGLIFVLVKVNSIIQSFNHYTIIINTISMRCM